MKGIRFLALLAILSPACDSVTEPQVQPQVETQHVIIHNGAPYPQVDQQFARFYAFNNCLTGFWPEYLPNPNCPVVDVMYEVGTIANNELANVFPQGVVVDANASRASLANYLNIIETGYSIGRMTCRARYALRKIGSALDTVLIDIAAGRPVDLSKLPQPLDADIMTTSPFAGANDGGVACAPITPPAPLAPAGGYSLFALNTSCADAGRSIEFSGRRSFITQSVHSQASVRVAGTDNDLIGNTTYRCSQSVAPTAYLANGPTLTASRAAPFSYRPADFPCTFSRTGNWNLNLPGPWWVGGSPFSRQLQPGTYCGTGNISLSVPLVRGTVTLSAAGTITIRSTAPSLRAFANSVVLYSRSTSNFAISLTGSSTSLSGHLYAPRGRVDVAGPYSAINGTIVARRIRISGNDVTVYASGAAY